MLSTLKVSMAAVVLFMAYIIYSTSVQSNLFDLINNWGNSSAENPYPWFSATLYDFYCNVFIIYCWILYKETAWWSKILWLIILVCLGSPASAIYVLIQIYKLKPGQGIEQVLLKS